MDESYCKKLKNELISLHNVILVNRKEELIGGDICFLLGCYEIIGKKYLSLYNHNIVIHETDLPQGRGWSPMSWQIFKLIHYSLYLTMLNHLLEVNY